MNYDLTEMPETYDAGRAYSPEVLRFWLRTISRGVQDLKVSRILDLGCGTGRYASVLAEHFDADVEAIDPSEKMLAQARRKPHPRTRFQQASGESVPLADKSVDLVFMSMVLHHLAVPELVVRECFRVLLPNGHLCLRAGTQEQVPTYPYVPFFPSSLAILESMLLPTEEIISLFAQANFDFVSHEVVQSEVAPGWAQYAAKLSHRADSVLASIPDEEFRAGLDAVNKHATMLEDEGRVIEPIDFFVFRRTETVIC